MCNKSLVAYLQLCVHAFDLFFFRPPMAGKLGTVKCFRMIAFTIALSSHFQHLRYGLCSCLACSWRLMSTRVALSCTVVWGRLRAKRPRPGVLSHVMPGAPVSPLYFVIVGFSCHSFDPGWILVGADLSLWFRVSFLTGSND